MSKLVPPHGRAELMPLLLPEAKRAERLRRAQGLIQVPMTSRETSDFLMLGMGAYTPLAGFMGQRGLAQLLRRHEALDRPVLANPDHALLRQGSG